MSELGPLREAVETLASRAPSPDFGEIERRARRRRRRRVAMVAPAVAAVVATFALAVSGVVGVLRAPEPAAPPSAPPGPDVNGWVALEDGRDIYLVRPGEDARRLEVPGSGTSDEVCPAWSPDGTRLLFSRFAGPGEGTSADVELVIVPVGRDGAAGAPTVIGVDGFQFPESDPRPCGIWAPDGRWVAFAGTGAVGVVDTQTGTTRRLPDLWPSDLAWRPGTDELAIAGDVGVDRGEPTWSTAITLYSVSTGESRRLGSVEAAHISWSPDGSTLAYMGGESGARRLWLVDADGADERILDADVGYANHGIGPEWSPQGDRIVYQRVIAGSRENHEVVLVDAADGTRTVISPPTLGTGRTWYPFSVSWAPDGRTLLYAAWSIQEGPGGDGGFGDDGVIAVPVDSPDEAAVLVDGFPPQLHYYNRWAPNQLWGRQPG